MKVLLVNPLPSSLMRINPPMGLGYVGAALKHIGHDVEVLDQVIVKDSSARLDGSLRSFKPDIVGIAGYSTQYPAMKRVASISKKFGSTVVAGGVHSSAFPEYVLKDCPDIDFVIKGEGERPLPSLLQAGSAIGIPGLYYRSNGDVKGQPSELVENLDSLQFPWSVLNPKDYCGPRQVSVIPRYLLVAPVLTSRGCPYGCSFCCASVVLGKRIRLRSASNVLDEIELLVKSFGIREIQIIDDNFSFYPEHLLSVCREIRKRNLKISLALTNGIRADRVSKEILRELKDAGCYYFAVGIESGSEKILKSISKSLSLDKVRETVGYASKMGFITQGFFMMGFPYETKEDRDMSMKFASELPLDRIAVNPIISMPGSALFVSQYGNRVEEYVWTHSGTRGWKPIPNAPSYSTVKRSILMIRLRFYLNPIRDIRHILKMRTLYQFLGIFRGLKTLVKE